MVIYFPYALCWGIALSLLTLVGCMVGNKYYILTGMVFSALIASPITSFTVGAAGAVYASDLVAVVLLLCWFLPSTRALMSPVKPSWYRYYFWLMIVALFSVIFIAPLTTRALMERGLIERVRSPIPGIPLPFLIMGFRILRIILYLIFFAYPCRMLSDEKSLRFVYKIVLLTIVILGICQIIHSAKIMDMSFSLPGVGEWAIETRWYILGQQKMAVGRIYLVGIFVCLIFLYRSWATPMYLAALCTIAMALLFSGSRAGLVGLLAAFFIFGLRSKFLGKLLVVLLIAALPIGFMVLSRIVPERTAAFMQIITEPSSNYRWIIWKATIANIASHIYILITGVGFANFRYAMGAGMAVDHAHSDILTCISEMGIVGATIFLLFLYHLWRDISSKIKYTVDKFRWEALCMNGIFVGFVITSLFENSLYYSAHTLCMQRILLVLFGSYSAFWLQQQYSLSSEYLYLDSSFSDDNSHWSVSFE